MKNLEPWKFNFAETLAKGIESGLLRDPLAAVSEAYLKRISEWCFHRELNANSTLRIVYTAMHGVGGKWAHKAFATFSLPSFFPVMEQLYPDPAFPTVPFPNPEEGEGALRLSFLTADRVGAPLVFANDPDADRFAVAERQVRKTLGDVSFFFFSSPFISFRL